MDDGRNVFLSMADGHGIDMSGDGDIQAASALFMFKAISAGEFTARIRKDRDVKASEVAKLRADLNGSGYAGLHLKPFLFRVAQSGMAAGARRDRLGRKWGVREADLELADLMGRDDVREGMAHLMEFASLSPDRLKEYQNSMYGELERYSRRLVWRKLRFVFQALNGMSMEDMVHECIAHGYRNIMMTYPRISSRLHALNIARRAAHNAGINMILAATRKCRENIRRSSDGWFEARVIGMDESVMDRMAERNVDDGDGRDEVDGRFAYDAIMDRVRNPEKRLMLELMTGRPDPEFSSWLRGSAQVPKSFRMDCDDLYDVLHRRGRLDRYIDFAAEYAGVGTDEARAFCRRMRERLS